MRRSGIWWRWSAKYCFSEIHVTYFFAGILSLFIIIFSIFYFRAQHYCLFFKNGTGRITSFWKIFKLKSLSLFCLSVNFFQYFSNFYFKNSIKIKTKVNCSYYNFATKSKSLSSCCSTYKIFD